MSEDVNALDDIELASQVKSYQKRTQGGKVVTVRAYTRVNTDNNAVTERARSNPSRPRIAASSGRFPGDRALPMFPDAGKTVQDNQDDKVEYEGLEDTGVVDQAALDKDVPIALKVLANLPTNPALKKLISILQGLSSVELSVDPAFDPDVVELARGIVKVSGYSYVSPKTGKIVRVNPYTQLRSLINALGGPMMSAKKGITADLLDRALPGYEVKSKVFQAKKATSKSSRVAKAAGVSKSKVAEKLNNIQLPREFDLQPPRPGENYLSSAMRASHPLQAVRNGLEGSSVTRGNDTWVRAVDGLWYRTPRKNNKGIDDKALTQRLAERGGSISFSPAEPMRRKSFPMSKVDYSDIDPDSPNAVAAAKYYRALEPVMQNLPEGIADSLNGHIAVQTDRKANTRSYARMTQTVQSKQNDYYPLLRINSDKDFEADLLKALPKQQEQGYSAPSMLHPTETLITKAVADWSVALMESRAPSEMTDRMYQRLNEAYDKHIKDGGSYIGLTGREGWNARLTGRRSKELRDDITNKLSMSATNSPQDFLSEAWVEFVGSPSPRDLSQDLGRAFQNSLDEFSDYMFKNKWVDASEIPERTYNRNSYKSPSRKVSDSIGGFEDYTTDIDLTPRDLRDVLISKSRYVDVRDDDGNPIFDIEIQREGNNAFLGALSYPKVDADSMPDGIPQNIDSYMFEDNARYYSTPAQDLAKGPSNKKYFANYIDQQRSLDAIAATEETLLSEGVTKFEVSAKAQQDSLLYAQAGYRFHPVSTDVADISEVLNNIQAALDASAWKTPEDKGFWEIPKDVRSKTQRDLNAMVKRLHNDPDTFPTPKEIADLGKYHPTDRSLGEEALSALSWDGIKTTPGHRDDVPAPVSASVINSAARNVKSDIDAGSTSLSPSTQTSFKEVLDSVVDRHKDNFPDLKVKVSENNIRISDKKGSVFEVDVSTDSDGITLSKVSTNSKDPKSALVAFDALGNLESTMQQSGASKLKIEVGRGDSNFALAASGYDWGNPPDTETLRKSLDKAISSEMSQIRESLTKSLAQDATRGKDIQDISRLEANLEKYLVETEDNLRRQANSLLEKHDADPQGVHPFEIAQLGKKEALEVDQIISNTPGDFSALYADQLDNMVEDPPGIFAEMLNTDGDYGRDSRIEFLAKQVLTMGGYEWYKTLGGFWQWSVRDANSRSATVGLLYLLLRLVPASIGRGAALATVNQLTKRIKNPAPDKRPSKEEIQETIEDLGKLLPPGVADSLDIPGL